ncbi:hypothetical protein OOZ51_03370 [Arthrobacter sp. MI7-26]|uniref:hypothetical protein n=1 Tax=Arthrobacter sp. MI7-26 TaxID=2993653 RepID=UPI002248D5DE|nr:hypothetical protein [Arthrobacter sp. MI7-26]MCX2746852.1 hypothetical protein [Arthrobacter sp. MI7-26]
MVGYALAGARGHAADGYLRAAGLNPSQAARETMLLRAVDAMVGAGQLPHEVAASEALGSLSSSPLRDAVGGFLAILRGNPSQADDLLIKAWSAVDPSSDPVTAAGVCQRQVLHALGRFNGRELVLWAGRALELAQPGSLPAVESQAILGLGAMGRFEEAERSYHAADHLPEYNAQHQRNDMGRGGCTRPWTGWRQPARCWPVQSPRNSGTARSAFPSGLRPGSPGWIELIRPIVHWSGAQIHALRGNWAAAERHLERGAAAADSYPVMLLPYCLAQAQVAETKADYAGVIRALAPVLRMQRAGGIDEPGFWP